MGLVKTPQPTKVNDSSKTKAENTMDLRAGLLRRFNRSEERRVGKECSS